ncbi:hypothetical protein [Microvirga sp. 2TAF3]|uniref:hypothetical protein n=1 Tax=Microvirga sp. 2TAF3 TaxID=3233014 RepID=UPI003F9B2696
MATLSLQSFFPDSGPLLQAALFFDAGAVKIFLRMKLNEVTPMFGRYYSTAENRMIAVTTNPPAITRLIQRRTRAVRSFAGVVSGTSSISLGSFSSIGANPIARCNVMAHENMTAIGEFSPPWSVITIE